MLRDELRHWHPDAALQDADPDRLVKFAHELEFSSPAVKGEPSTGDGVCAWVARTPEGSHCTARHYIVGALDPLGKPEVLGAPIRAAAKLRSYLSPDEQSELTFLLIASEAEGPAGLRRRLERNEAFGRMLVWTPNSDPARWPEEAGALVKRLRLTEFTLEDLPGGANLSPLSEVLSEATVPDAERAAWLDALTSADLKPSERVDRLVEVVLGPQGARHG